MVGLPSAVPLFRKYFADIFLKVYISPMARQQQRPVVYVEDQSLMAPS